MSRAHFAFAAHPDAIADLQALPDRVRDLALLELQNLVHGSNDCLPLQGRLAGFHKVYVDPAVSYRMVIQFRPAPPSSAHDREVFLVAAGSRKDYAVYRSAQLRTAPEQADARSAAEARVRAAQSRSSGAAGRQAAVSAASAASVQPPTAAARRVAQR